MDRVKNNIIPMLSLLLLLGLSAAYARAAELIRTPGGIMVRAIGSFEKIADLQAEVGGEPQRVNQKNGVWQTFFTDEQLCQAPRYRALQQPNADAPWISLQMYCGQKQRESLSFLAITDTHNELNVHERAAATFSRLFLRQEGEYQFVLNLGDIVDYGGNVAYWRDYYNVTGRLYASQTPLIAVVGNHDHYGDAKLKNYNILYQTSDTFDHYYLHDLGPAYLIVLHSVMDAMPLAESQRQTDWLQATLSEIAGKKPIIVAYHHPAFTSGTSVVTMPLNPLYIRNKWLPLFSKYGVNLVLNGHDHFYERLVVDGVHYITMSSLGGGLAKPSFIHSKYSEKIITGHYTVAALHVNAQGQIEVDTRDGLTGEVLDKLQI